MRAVPQVVPAQQLASCAGTAACCGLWPAWCCCCRPTSCTLVQGAGASGEGLVHKWVYNLQQGCGHQRRALHRGCTLMVDENLKHQALILGLYTLALLTVASWLCVCLLPEQPWTRKACDPQLKRCDSGNQVVAEVTCG